MKYWILLSKLENGGLEKVQLTLIKGLLEKGLDITLVTGKISAEFNLEVTNRTKITEIAKSGAFTFPFNLLKEIFIGRPDQIITTSNDIACIAILIKLIFFRKIRIVATQHLSLSGPIDSAGGLKKLKLKAIKRLMKSLYPFTDSIVAVTKAVAEDLADCLKLRDIKIDVIYNPIITKGFHSDMVKPCPNIWPEKRVPIIIYVGRLSAEKRLDMLLFAFEKVLEHLQAHLLILGNGPQERLVQELIKERNWQGVCKSVGFVQNVLPYINQATVLVLPSDYEGFGSVIVEAMGCGTQVIATDCPSGPAEILEKGRFGQLIPTNNPNALVEAILKVITGEKLIDKEALKERAMEFDANTAIEKYYCVLTSKSKR
jgi:glycosyltransferase involved in cell wall biosynthesis